MNDGQAQTRHLKKFMKDNINMSQTTHAGTTPVHKHLPLFQHSFATVTTIAGLLLLVAVCRCSSPPKANSNPTEKWVGTWGTALQLVEPRNLPPDPGLSNNTLRQIVCVSIGGSRLRVRFSNEFGTSPVTLDAVHIAVPADSCIIIPSTDKALSFDGKPGVTIAAGSAVTSDPFNFTLKPRGLLAITIHFGDTSPDVTGHPGSRTTSYLLPGNQVASVGFSGALTADHWYIISDIDVGAPDSAAALVVLGNSITDGRGSGTNKQDRWPDELAIRLQQNPGTQQVAVLNMGIGGNCVLRDCLGPAALIRFESDVIEQAGVRWLIILEGINDIGQVRGERWATLVAYNLIAAYKQMIDRAHAKGIRVYGATMTPFGGSFYDSPERQTAWKQVNDWIRTSGRFDAVIDLDAALRDPAHPLQLLPADDSGDHLHPSEAGHRAMAKAVDLTLFQ